MIRTTKPGATRGTVSIFDRTARLRQTQASLHSMWNLPVFRRSITRDREEICDFITGNSQDMPLASYVEAIQRAAVPRDPNWFSYGPPADSARAAIVETLRSRLDLPFEPEDVFPTFGGTGAINAGIRAVTNPGDEAIFLLPPWFYYEFYLVDAGVTPRKVLLDRQTFDLDLAAIEAAITPRTRLVIINTPHNPTGRIYPPESLKALADLLDTASQRNGRAIYLLSDEVYSRIVFDGRAFHSPLAFYPHAMLAYSYGKTLLTPGERIGYLALSPHTAHREELRESVHLACDACSASGWAYVTRLHQHAIPDLEQLSIDLSAVERRRDRLVGELRAMGYEVRKPEGTFWVLPTSPWEDDWAFWQLLMEHNIFGVPGRVLEFPGFFRLSLTASDDMVERSLPGFAAAIEYATTHEPDTRVANG